MLGAKHFHVEVGYDEQGVLVSVAHPLTGSQRRGRPGPGESVRTVQDRLIREIASEFLRLDEFAFHVGRCEVNGKLGDMYTIEHIPSGTRKSSDTVSRPGVRNQELLDEFLQELWAEGHIRRG